MKRISSIILLSFLLVQTLRGQTLVTPQVINSAGGSGSAGGGVEIDWSIGETVVATFTNSNTILTQGFLQPPKLGLSALAYITPVSCADKTDGVITIRGNLSGTNVTAADSIVYIWSSPSLCSSNTCSMVTNVPAGTYSVIVKHYVGGIIKDSVIIQSIIVIGSTEPCQITIFNGLTPNGDGANDYFAINNIEQFPGNMVSIYNRWGLKLFETKDYNNTNNYWAGTTENSKEVAASGTYFYVIDLNNGTKPLKGWVELTHR